MVDAYTDVGLAYLYPVDHSCRTVMFFSVDLVLMDPVLDNAQRVAPSYDFLDSNSVAYRRSCNTR